MPGKINVTGIIKAHLRTLKNPATGKHRPLDYVTLFLLPGGAAGALLHYGIEASPTLAAAMATAFPLAAVLLSTTLHAVLETARPTCADVGRPAKDLVSNIIYGILACILGTAAAAASLVTPPGAAKHAADFTLYFLSLHAGLTAVMVLSRLRALVSKHLEG